jgi:hypothetical protein
MPSTTIARGNSLSTFYIQPTLTPTAVATAGASQNYSVPGLLTTDNIIVLGIVGSQTNGVVAAEADCLTAGVLTIQWLNATGSSATPATGQYVLQIVRSEGPLPATAV